jgi:hypothetical protein
VKVFRRLRDRTEVGDRHEGAQFPELHASAARPYAEKA